MEYRISELMSGYGDDRIDLADQHITTAGRVKELTMARIQPAVTPIRRGRKLGRMLLVAATIALALAATAIAVYQYTVADLIMEVPESTAYAPAEEGGEAAVETPDSAAGQPFYAFSMENGTDLYYYSLAGYDKESPEYKAQQEWLYYLYGSDHMLDARELLPQSDPHRLYGVGYESMAEDLDALAGKYDLELAQAEYYLTGTYYKEEGETMEDIYDLLGVEPFVNTALVIHGGSLYNEGSFTVCGDLAVPGQEDTVFVNVYCAMDGTLPTFQVTGEAADSMEYKTVTTDSGVTADLELGQYYSILFVTMDNCHVLVDVSGGCADDDRKLTMDDLEAVANCFDYERVDEFDRDQRSDTVYALFAETLENTDWMQEDPGAEAKEIFALLGDYGLAALPEGYYFSANRYTAAADSMNTLWADVTGGGAFCEIGVQYSLSGDDRDLHAIQLKYSRYWQDAEMTTVNNRLGFDPAYIFMDEVDTTKCTVNGYEAYYTVLSEIDAGYVYETMGVQTMCLTWLDTDRELVFRLTFPDSFTPEQAIAMAESVTAQ